jgi:hypothetical protein
MNHIIILRKLQKIKMRIRTANQSEKIPKKDPKPSSQQIHKKTWRDPRQHWVWTQADSG